MYTNSTAAPFVLQSGLITNLFARPVSHWIEIQYALSISTAQQTVRRSGFFSVAIEISQRLVDDLGENFEGLFLNYAVSSLGIQASDLFDLRVRFFIGIIVFEIASI